MLTLAYCESGMNHRIPFCVSFEFSVSCLDLSSRHLRNARVKTFNVLKVEKRLGNFDDTPRLFLSREGACEIDT